MRDTFVATLLEAAKTDKNIILMTGDLGYGVLDTFQKELPNQFINSGVNEQAMMGMAAGYASTASAFLSTVLLFSNTSASRADSK